MNCNAPVLLSRLFVVSLCLAPLLARAQSGATVCAKVMLSSDRTACMQAIAGHTVDPGAAAVCQTVMMSADLVACVRGALDKVYRPEELAVCRATMMSADKAACIAAAGFIPAREEPRSRRRGDDAEDDRRSRRRSRDDDDEEDDRRSRRRSRDDDPALRTMRLTNYNATTLTRLYWRADRDDRFHAVRLAADVPGNRYQDFQAPDRRSLQFCAETWDGYRLFWARVDRSSPGLDVAVNERNFERGRCDEL